MSRIKEALEKAKKMKEAPEQVAFSEEAFHKTTVAPVRPSIQTRVIDYCKATAKKHKILNPLFENHVLTEQFKLLRTQILSKIQTQSDKTLLITSCIDGEGKTFNAINLAITFAREVDQTVLLVDVNFRNPSILHAFGIKTKEGLTDYLLHDKPIQEILIRPGIEKLTVLPAGRSLIDSAEILRSLKMQRLIAEMKNRYDNRYIFFDAPSILTCVDTLVLSKHINKALLVIEAGKVAPEKMVKAINLIGAETILGTVLNKRSVSEQS